MCMKVQGVPITEYIDEEENEEYKGFDHLTEEENLILKDIHEANFYNDELIDTAIFHKVFIPKKYMSDSSIYSLYAAEINGKTKDTSILRILIKNYRLLEVEAGISVNKALLGITYLTMISKDNSKYGLKFDSQRLPDKKLSQIMQVDRGTCHRFIYFLANSLFKDHIKIEQNKINKYYTIFIDRNFFNADPLINELMDYVFPKHLSMVRFKSRKERNKYISNYKKQRLVKISSLKNSADFYYKHSLFEQRTSRNCFKQVMIGSMYYYSQITENIFVPEKLKEFRNKKGQREDLVYVNAPLVLLTSVTDLKGKEITKRLRSTVRGLGGEIYFHNLSYKNIENPEDEMEFLSYDEYSKKRLLKRGVKDSISKEEYDLANIQGYKVDSCSFIMMQSYFNTANGRFILENKDLFLYIIKKYFVEQLNSNNFPKNEEEYFKLLENKEIITNIIRRPLYKDEVENLLENSELKDIDLDNVELREAVAKLLNKDKLFSLPIVKAREEKAVGFSSCYLKDENGKAISTVNKDEFGKVTSVEYQLKHPMYCIYPALQVIKNLTDVHEDLSKDMDNIKCKLNTICKMVDHIAKGFLDKKNIVNFLKRLISYDKNRLLIGMLLEREESEPYRKYLIYD